MAKAKRKSNSKKTTPKPKPAVSQPQFDATQIAALVNQTNALITHLHKQAKKPFAKNKQLITNQINELNAALAKQNYAHLDKLLTQLNWNSSADDANQPTSNNSAKAVGVDNQTNLPGGMWGKVVQFFNQKNLSIPVYSRVTKWQNNYEGADLWKRYILLGSIAFVLFILLLIGILIFAEVIPYVISTDEQKIFPAFLIAFSLFAFFFL